MNETRIDIVDAYQISLRHCIIVLGELGGTSLVDRYYVYIAMG